LEDENMQDTKAAGAPERSAIDSQWKWNLEAIFASNEDWDKLFTKTKALLPELSASIEELSRSSGKNAQKIRDDMLKALTLANSANLNLSELFTYARMRRDEDNRNPLYQGYVQRAEMIFVEIDTAMAPLRPALLGLPDGTIERAMEDRDFQDFTAVLRSILNLKPHTLPAEIEQVIAQAGEVMSAPANAFDMLTDADMKFPEIIGEDGNPVEVSSAKYGTLLESRDPRVRKEAFEKHHETFKTFGNTIASLYAASVKSDIYNARTHKYGSSREAALWRHEIPVAVYDRLIEAVSRHLPSVELYMKAKKEALGLSEIHVYDQYVNTESGFGIKLPYQEAYSLVVESLAPLGKEYQEQLHKA